MICRNCATDNQQHHLPPNTCAPARQQPHPAEIRRWRRQSVQMGRKICVCLSRCNPWRDISRGVGNSSAQTVDDHVLVNGRTRKRSAAGGWSEAEVCAEGLPLRGRPCMEDNASASGSSCELANPAQVRQIASQTEVLFSAR